jgi:hypothetical protein
MRPNPPKNSEGVIRKTTKPAKCSARPPSASDRGYSALHRALQRLVQRGLGFLVSFRSQNILDLLRTKSSGKLWPTPPHRCHASIRTLNARLRARFKLGFDLNTRSITPVMNLGWLGLPSMARSS